MAASMKKQIESCVNLIKEATYGKDDVWKVLAIRKDIGEIIGSKSMKKLREVQEGIKNHPNIIFRLHFGEKGRKPLEYRYVSKEEKLQYSQEHLMYNYIDQFCLDYIKSQIEEDASSDTIAMVSKIMDALCCKKAHNEWLKVDIDELSVRVLLSSDDIQYLLNYMKDHKLLLQLENEPIYRVIMSEQSYEEALEELNEPDVIRSKTGAKLVKMKDKALLLKNFISSDEEESFYSGTQVNHMLGSLVKKRLDDYFEMENRLSALEKENETLRAAMRGTLINSEDSSNTFNALHRKYLEYEEEVLKLRKEVEILNKAEIYTRRKIVAVKNRIPKMKDRMIKTIDNFVQLDKSQLTDPRIVKRVKEDMQELIERTTTEIMEL